MLAKLKAVKDKASGLIDKAQVKAVGLLVETLHPKVHTVIDGRVDAFRDQTLEVIPQQCEDGLKARTESSTVAWMLDKVLGDNTDILVEKLLAQIKPGIRDATDGLSATATDEIMAKLKDWLDGDDEEIGAGVKGSTGGAAAAGEAEAPAAEMEQLQVAEEQSRSLDAAADEPAGTEAPAASSTSGRSFHKSALSAVGALAGGMIFGLDDQLPKFEAAARELVHPLFEKLKAEVWELVPAALQESLQELVGEKGEAVVEAAEVDTQQQSRGISSWMNKVTTKLQGKAGDVVSKVAALTLDTIDGPMQTLINGLVDDLETTATGAAFREIRAKLVEYKLVSAEAAAAGAVTV